MKRHDLDTKSAMSLLFSTTSPETSPTSATAPPVSPFPSQQEDEAMISDTGVAKTSVENLSSSVETGKAINFLEIRGKPSHLFNDKKPIHPLALLAS